MGQYWHAVNLDKKECLHPHKLASGLKLWEQLANPPGVGAALIILCAAMPVRRGGGDFDLDQNWHGTERTLGDAPGPMTEEYQAVAHRTIGRWAGDRIALVGDYAEDTDLPPEFEASQIYDRCAAETRETVNDVAEGASFRNEAGRYVHYVTVTPAAYADVTDDVCRVIEHELGGTFTGAGWRHWERTQTRQERLIEAVMTVEQLARKLGEPLQSVVTELVSQLKVRQESERRLGG